MSMERGRRAASAAGAKVIAVDIDDTLNDFTETLQRAAFPFDPDYGLEEAKFHAYLGRIRNEAPEATKLLSTEYSFFRHRIHMACYALAQARADGVEFMQWLRREGWNVVICTRRDLRRGGRSTIEWLRANAIPFDRLFSAANKIAFCRAWEISDLVDDDPNSIEYGHAYGVRIFYPVARTPRVVPPSARGFRSFDEVKGWLRG